MSAWIVSKGHIDALVQGLVVEQLVEMNDAAATGRLLWEECRRSVAYRYPNDADGEWPGPIDLTIADINAYVPEMIESPLNDAKLAHQLACYGYQSCEHPEWETSEAYRLVKTLEGVIGLRNGCDVTDPNSLWNWTRRSEPLPWGIDNIRECV